MTFFQVFPHLPPSTHEAMTAMAGNAASEAVEPRVKRRKSALREEKELLPHRRTLFPDLVLHTSADFVHSQPYHRLLEVNHLVRAITIATAAAAAGSHYD